ncbi:MAG TPA: SpoIIE family protein phosphatase [Streptosporangiaceae bacterium]
MRTGDGAPEAAPSLLHQVVGVARLAVAILDGQARITHWNRAADDVFGIPGADAVSRRFPDLLRAPVEHRGVFEPTPRRFPHTWYGAITFVPVRGGRSRELICWVYPLDGPDAARLVIVATDARRLREEGPGLAVGDLLAAPPGAHTRPIDGAVRVLRVEPVTAQVPEEARRGLGRRISDFLPRMGPDAGAGIVAQILAHGYPAINLSTTIRLPVGSYWSGMPRVKRVRPAYGPTGPPAPGTDDAHGPTPERSENRQLKERLSFLNDASSRIGGELDLSRTARDLAEMIVPRFADFASIQMLEDVLLTERVPEGAPGEAALLRRVALSHVDEPGRWDDIAPLGEVGGHPADVPYMEGLRTGKPFHLPVVRPELAAELAGHYTDRDMVPLLENRSLLVLPLIARGRVLGLMVLIRHPGRAPFDDLDAVTGDDLATRAALALHNALLYKRERATAHTLQESMLARRAPDLHCVDVAHRYLPSEAGVEVGGDWFDAIRLPGGRAALVVGDVMGHGLHAAAIMGQFRMAVRTLASMDLPPEQVLRHLDDLAQRLGEDYPARRDSESHLATCLYVVYDPVSRTCEAANAGHVPPVLVHPDGRSEPLDPPSGAPIGVGGVAFEPFTFSVEDGSRLVLCTDGLVEVRGEDIGIGLAALCEKLAGNGPEASVDELCEQVVRALWSPQRADDVALLIARFRGISADEVDTWTLPSATDPRMVRAARGRTREVLTRWGLDDRIETVELLVSELVTNAIRHGAGPVTLRLLRTGRLLCEVYDTNRDLPVLVSSGPDEEHGRGMQLVSRMSERWGTSRTAGGKVVWFEYDLSTG